MANIEEMFKKQLDNENIHKILKRNNLNSELCSNKNINFDEILSQIPNDDEYQKMLDEKIGESVKYTERKWTNSNGEVEIHKFENKFEGAENIKVSDLVSNEENVTTVVEHFFCPKCGEELISLQPVMWNPFDLKKTIVRTECSNCKFVSFTDTAIPRVKYYNKNNEEIKAFHE